MIEELAVKSKSLSNIVEKLHFFHFPRRVTTVSGDVGTFIFC